MVEVPNNNTKLDNQVYQVDQIDTSAEVQPEVMVFSMIGGSGGSINLKIIRTDSKGKITYNVNRTVSYACSASSFASALNAFQNYAYYRTTVVR